MRAAPIQSRGRYRALLGALAGLWLALGSAPASAADSAILSTLGGACPGHPSWSLALRGGWPTSGARAQVGLGKCVAIVGEMDTVVLRRFQPAAGFGFTVVGTESFRLSWEVLAGGMVQVGALAERGPTATVRIRVAGVARGVAVPYMSVGLRGTLFFDRTRYLSPDSADAETFIAVTSRWGVEYSFGLGLALHRNLGLFFGVDLGVADMLEGALTLPGVHAGLAIGGLP